MSAVELPTEGVETAHRDHPAGPLVYESYPAGTWLTKAGKPARKDKRRYALNDQDMDSVSSIVGTLDKPALAYWIEDHSCRGAVQAERMGELEGCPPEEIMHRVKALGLGSSAARDEGAARGHATHATFEGLAEHGTMPDLASFPADIRPFAQGAAGAWLELDPKPVHVEYMVCHQEHGYAGRLDLIADVGGKLTLLDWKTGKGRVYDAAHYQTKLYDLALRTEGIQVERILIVGVADDGSHQVVECEATDEDALALLWLFRSRKRINAGMANQRKGLKAAAKEAA